MHTVFSEKSFLRISLPHLLNVHWGIHTFFKGSMPVSSRYFALLLARGDATKDSQVIGTTCQGLKSVRNSY